MGLGGVVTSGHTQETLTSLNGLSAAQVLALRVSGLGGGCERQTDLNSMTL